MSDWVVAYKHGCKARDRVTSVFQAVKQPMAGAGVLLDSIK